MKPKFSSFFSQSGKLNWHEYDYCAIDLETTGLELNRDEIVAVGVSQISNGRIVLENNFYSQVKPDNQPSTSSMKIHGLRNVDLAGSPSMKAILPEIREALKDRIVIAHASWVERAFLDRQAKGLFPRRVLDTATLAKTLGVAENIPGQEPSLEYVARKLNLPVYAPHNALGDAMTTSVVFLALLNILEREVKSNNFPFLTLQMIWDKAK